MSTSRKTVLVTGGARRVGRLFALGCAQMGWDVVIHHGHSDDQVCEYMYKYKSTRLTRS